MKKNVIKATFILSLLTLSGCFNGSRPDRKQLESMISATIPTFTSLEKTKFDFAEVSDDKIKANFKATVKAQENLFAQIEDNKLDTDTLVIDTVHQKGSELEVYGYILGVQNGKEWDLLTPIFESGLEQLGSPQGNFEPTTLIKDSTAYAEALKEQELKRQEIAKLEAEREQARQQRIEAAKALFKKGAVFSGNLIWKNNSQPIQVKIVAIVGSTYIVECSNPQQSGISQIFEGKIVDQPGEPARLVLRPRSPQQMAVDIWEFYKRDGSLVLIPTEVGIDGNANTDHILYQYRIVLRS